MDHLSAIRLRLSHERERLRNARTEGERELRAVWVSQIEKEERDELKFLGKPDESPAPSALSEDELLRELKGN